MLQRHLVDRAPFELMTLTTAEDVAESPSMRRITRPFPIGRMRKTRVGPPLVRWLNDLENLVWPKFDVPEIEAAIKAFTPDLILTVADTCLSEIAARAAKRHRLPLATLFLDWFPAMKGYVGHPRTQAGIDARFRSLYRRSDLAICTSDGMQEVLGPHANSHVVYPMPGHFEPKPSVSRGGGVKRFRLIYVGSIENFYGRMIRSLIDSLRGDAELEIVVVGPNPDWPAEALDRASREGVYLGFKPPHEAAQLQAQADALLVVMSFEQEHELFMRTSFTTKLLDCVALGKPVILWGPEYCTPVRVIEANGGALLVRSPDAQAVVDAARGLCRDPATQASLGDAALRLRRGIFSPDRLQSIFVGEVERTIERARGTKHVGEPETRSGAMR